MRGIARPLIIHAPHLTKGSGVRAVAKPVPVPAPPSRPQVPAVDHRGWLDHAIAHAPKWARGLVGGLLWAALHKRALAVPAGSEDSAWLGAFRMILACGDCRKHWDAMLAATPPDWGNYFAWTVDRHNEVNRRLGKREMGLEEALQRWSGAPATAVQSSEGEAPREG